MRVIYEMKILLLLIKNTCISVTHPILCVSVYAGCYIYILGSYDICIYMYIYLHVIEVCLKAMIAMFYLKSPSNIMKNVFNSIAIYS